MMGETSVLTAIILGMATTIGNSAPTDGTFCNDGIQVGWHFYCDPEPEPEVEPDEKPKPEIAKVRDEKPKVDDFKTAQQKLAVFANQVEELKAKAILEPTEANLIAYMRIQKVMIDKAETFQKAWSLALYKTPELDHNTVSPLTNSGIFDYQDKLNTERKAKLAEISQTHVLMLVVEKPEICYTCKTQTEIIGRMIPKFGLPIFVVTKDGYTYPALPNAERDNGNLKGLGLGENPTPFLAIIDPKEGKVFQIGHGLLTEDLILSRVLEVMSPSKLLKDVEVVNNDE